MITLRSHPITQGGTLMTQHGGSARSLTQQQHQLLEVLDGCGPIDEWALGVVINLLYPELSWGFERVRTLVAQLIASGAIQLRADGLLSRTDRL